jgi:hypothetical protein
VTDRFTGEQAALRRVATLVAQGAPPAEVLVAVAEEAGRLLRSDHATMGRYESDGTIRTAATWSSGEAAVPVGASAKIGGEDLHTMIFQTHRPARIDDTAHLSGPVAEAAR